MPIIQSIARTICATGVSALVLAAVTIGPARAETLLTGVNVPNATRAGPADRIAVTDQLKTAGVRIVRFPFGKVNASDIDYAAQLYVQGIKIDLIVGPQYRPDAPMRPPYPPNRAMYPGHPLSYADPELSRVYFQALLSQLDAKAVVLAGIELGNEINWSAFNGEFPLPGEGKIFSLDDLNHDPEGQQIAKGLLQYLKILAVLKDVRDHSTVNRNTPIISAGLSPTGPARATGGKEDGVSIEATIQFLQRNGLDGLVDAYGIHFYPWQKAFDQIDTDLRNNVVVACQPAGARAGKPCWVTEWGVSNPSTSCPFDDSPRIPRIAHVMDDFRALARQGRVRAVLFYAWNNDPWSDKSKPDPSTIFRCGQLSNAGKIALTP